MIYYRTLWLAALLIGLANLIMAPFADGPGCAFAAVITFAACAVTYKQTWRNDA